MSEKLQKLLDLYSESHQNPKNIIIHKICVPLIVFSFFGLIMCLPLPSLLQQFKLDWTILIFIPTLFYYSSLSKKYALIIGAQLFLMLGFLKLLAQFKVDLFFLSTSLFILAWIAQFIGHIIEGKKPSFTDDLKFLLVGPLWTVEGIVKKVWKE